MAEWIKCEDRLPHKHQDVLMFFANDQGGTMTVGYLSDTDEHLTYWSVYTDNGWYTDCDDTPTYWAPLPDKPGAAARAATPATSRTRREDLVEALDAIETGMCRIKERRSIWQNSLIYALCQAVRLLLMDKIKEGRK